jgi:Fe-S cluster assembly protein SufB
MVTAPEPVENDISDIRVDSVGDFTFPERNKFDSGFGITSKTVDYISDVKDDPDWVREFRHKALKVFQDKPMPTHWATKDLENIHFDEFRYYLSDGQKPKRSWDDVPEDVKKTFDRLGIPSRNGNSSPVSKRSTTAKPPTRTSKPPSPSRASSL